MSVGGVKRRLVAFVGGEPHAPMRRACQPRSDIGDCVPVRSGRIDRFPAQHDPGRSLIADRTSQAQFDIVFLSKTVVAGIRPFLQRASDSLRDLGGHLVALRRGVGSGEGRNCDDSQLSNENSLNRRARPFPGHIGIPRKHQNRPDIRQHRAHHPLTLPALAGFESGTLSRAPSQWNRRVSFPLNVIAMSSQMQFTADNAWCAKRRAPTNPAASRHRPSSPPAVARNRSSTYRPPTRPL